MHLLVPLNHTHVLLFHIPNPAIIHLHVCASSISSTARFLAEVSKENQELPFLFLSLDVTPPAQSPVILLSTVEVH